MKNSRFSEEDVGMLMQIFSSQKIIRYLKQQIKELYEIFEDSYTFSLSNSENHLFINFHRIGSLKSDTTDGSNSLHYESYQYILKITKGFPLYGVRLHIFKANNLQPSLSDSRDLVYEVLGDIWTYRNKLKDIIKKLSIFEQKLSCRNENNLGMQKTGQFQLGDIYTRQQLQKFTALQIYQDHTPNKKKVLLATTQTHLLMFKANSPENTYFLNMACQLQCIKQIKKYGEHKLELLIYKYKKIKNFYQYDKIQLSCYLQQDQKFIRNTLKNITKFQKIETGLELADSWKIQKQFQAILVKMNQCQELQEILKEDRNDQKQPKVKKLSKNYQQIVEYFSARANCYYLIYVNKLNNLFAQNKQLK